ncbi:response regulator receiver and ANTAR domain protein [Halanaerobium saccharolyticum]|uniref:Stage 0 sporulation protein A homolog n=1 Tax=Halanaerobium saccharolyticum TaxID=43595 RepID=A0A4R7Z590_9FIRM|nr:response regulator [Halanaerobium saccharolyticum]RAK07853.1 response regulator receiver and ANTAR domain protein [Halanaerobium saccharolyticum]TDW04467.1 response regulator receiver and ANTAR domain protein [Halanaerobium saccharolyticum]TDX59803.1 response regulator receiver and ANTAR domain protein [Halanaerobium saccharolyticum]
MKKSLNIILAEDESIILMGIKSNIESLGHQVIAQAYDGVEAVKLALEKEVDLIIIDINMPKMDGIAAIEKINKEKFVPAIIVTGYNDEKLINRASRAGAFAYLIKPVDVNDIKPAINIAWARFEEFQKVLSELDSSQKALEARKIIEKAKGIVMDRKSIKESKAMKFLQKKSNDTNKKMIVIAKEIIEADQKFK